MSIKFTVNEKLIDFQVYDTKLSNLSQLELTMQGVRNLAFQDN